MPTLKIQGQVYNVIGSLQPINNVPKFLKVHFIVDCLLQVQMRINHISNLDPILVTELQNLLHKVNPCVQ